MRSDMREWLKSSAAGRIALPLALAAGLAGCGLDEVEQPALDGPSERGLALDVRAAPDILLANGFSTSVVTATLFGPNGSPVANREIVFTITDDAGRIQDLGSFIAPASFTDLGTSVTVRTNGQGVASVVYESPARTDATANQLVRIAARPVGNDATGLFYSNAAIELRSPEPRLFPADPTNDPTALVCNFAVQAPNGFRAGTTILFQSTSSDADGTIVRYEWFFTDGTVNDHPDIAHVFRAPGTYGVTHVVTDNDGLQKACTASVTVN
jgi:hypothetical protein